MSWESITIKEICKIKSGKRIPKGQDFSDMITDHPYIRARDIKDGRINTEELVYLEDSIYEKIKKYIINAGDIAITIVGASIGDVGYAFPNVDGFNLTENAVRLTDFNDNVNSKYVFYFLNSEIGQKHMKQIVGGAAQPKLGIYKIEKIPLLLPSKEKQDKIADILTIYDDLIENNQKQIKLLEEAAQRLYKEWFVDLRFPGYENTKIVDGVPEGWKKTALSDIADVVMGQSPKSEFYNQVGEGLPFHQGVGSYGTRFVKDETYSTSFTRIAEAGSILFSVRAPVGRLNITKNKIVIGRGIAALNHKNGLQSFMFYMLKERFFKDNLVGNGSIFASISKDELLNQEFIIPCEDVMVKYDKVVRNIDDKIASLDGQIELLTEARDRLLPKLMSGELEV